MTPAKAVKERPILFNAEMVRAILDGRKTQTRRPIKEQPEPFIKRVYKDSDGAFFASAKENGTHGHDYLMRECPYGQPGDRLWVRETWGQGAFHDGEEWIEGKTRYKADGALNPRCKWTPSIHMPRWASRILLEITNVRVERVQEITGPDAFAEGIGCKSLMQEPMRFRFKLGWEKIYPGSWERNDWVWVVEFKRIQPS